MQWPDYKPSIVTWRRVAHGNGLNQCAWRIANHRLLPWIKQLVNCTQIEFLFPVHFEAHVYFQHTIDVRTGGEES